MKFNPGDRVQRVLGTDRGGQCGVVEAYRGTDDRSFVYVLFDTDGKRFGSYPNRLILLQPSDDFEVDE